MGPMNQPKPRRRSFPSSQASASIDPSLTAHCKVCGRLLPGGKSTNSRNDTIVYCSHTCRKRRLTPFDKRIEEIFVELVQRDGEVLCSTVEEIVFSDDFLKNSGLESGGEKRRNSKGSEDSGNDSHDSDAEDQGGVRLGDAQSTTLDGVGEGPDAISSVKENVKDLGEDATIDEGRRRQLEGMEKAQKKERVKRAGRRVVAFRDGYICRSKNGKKLDISHAHGDWCVARA